jgi:hypothetical protein
MFYVARTVTIMCGLLMLTATAHAEHKMLITDVLDAKQVEARASLGYSYTENDFMVKSPFYQKGTIKHDVTCSSYSLGAGLGGGLQLHAEIPYYFSDKRTYEYTSPVYPSRYGKTGSWGDFAFGAKYLVMGGEEKPFAVVTGLDVKFETANERKEGSGTTDVSPYVAVSTTIDNWRPYVEYRATIRNHDANDSHLLALGAEYRINERVSLTPHANVLFRTASKVLNPYESYDFALDIYLQVARNFYLIPAFNAGFSSDTSLRDGSQDLSGAAFYGTGLGLYYLF